MDIGTKSFIIALPMAISFFALWLTYEDSRDIGRFSWRGLAISLAFFVLGIGLIFWTEGR